MQPHSIETTGEIATKCLKTKSGSGIYFVGNGCIIINCVVSQLHILTAHAMGEFVGAKWNVVDRTCSNAWRQQWYIRPRELSRSKSQVKRTVKAFQRFVNPYQLMLSQPLTSLSSRGATMPYEINHDSLKWQSKTEEFIRYRLLMKVFFNPIIMNMSERDLVQDHKWIHLSSHMAASKNLCPDCLSGHPDVIRNGNNRWLLIQGRPNTRT